MRNNDHITILYVPRQLSCCHVQTWFGYKIRVNIWATIVFNKFQLWAHKFSAKLPAFTTSLHFLCIVCFGDREAIQMLYNTIIDPSHKSHNASDNIPQCTICYRNVQTCTFQLEKGALWGVGLVHCEICILLYWDASHDADSSNVSRWKSKCVMHICVYEQGHHCFR